MSLLDRNWRVLKSIPVPGILALLIGAVIAERTSPELLIVGVLAVMLPVWAYRSRGSRSLEHMVKQIGYEAQDSVQAFFGFLTALSFAMFFIAEAFYGGAADFVAAMAAQAAGYPIPLAWLGTVLTGAFGINSGSLTTDQFVGIALVLGSLAVILRRS